MMTSMEMVGPLTVSEQEIMESLREMKLSAYAGTADVIVECREDKKWRLPAHFPQPIQEIFTQAHEAEAARNPHIDTYKAAIAIRLIKEEHHGYWLLAQRDAHFDGPEDTGHSSYLTASAPTTVQYTGNFRTESMKKRVRKVFKDRRKSAEGWYREYASKRLVASSVLPMHLYHFDENTLHSIPWSFSPPRKKVRARPKPRFFCRISFYPKVP